MKKRYAIVLAGGLACGTASAGDADIGCGVGTELMKGQNGLVFKVLGAFTNAIFFNQSFGITTGSLGCSQAGLVNNEARRSMFAAANVDQLSAEIAAGEGESLATLAALYAIADADRSAFYALAQSRHAELFPSAAVTTGDVLTALEAAMAADPRLARYIA